LIDLRGPNRFARHRRFRVLETAISFRSIVLRAQRHLFKLGLDGSRHFVELRDLISLAAGDYDLRHAVGGASFGMLGDHAAAPSAHGLDNRDTNSVGQVPGERKRPVSSSHRPGFEQTLGGALATSPPPARTNHVRRVNWPTASWLRKVPISIQP